MDLPFRRIKQRLRIARIPRFILLVLASFSVVLLFNYQYQYVTYGNSKTKSFTANEPKSILPRPHLEASFLTFAEKRQCEMKNWTFVDSLFRPFYEVGGISSDMLSKSANLDRTSTCTYNPGTKSLSPKGCAGGLDNVILNALQELRVDQTLTFTLNELDEPRIVFPSKQYSTADTILTKLTGQNEHSPNSILDVCRNVPSVTQNAKHHGFLMNPASLDLVFNNLLPVFSSSSIQHCFADIVVPSIYAVWEYLPEEEPVVEYRNRTNWNLKQTKMYWRGGSTGVSYSSSRYDLITGSHRTRFVAMFGKAPQNDVNNKVAQEIRKVQTLKDTRRQNMYDVGFTAFKQCDSLMCSEMNSSFTALPTDSSVRALDFKYLMDVDGNSFSRRFVYFLRWSASLVFKSALFQDWVSGFMEPWKHYIPVSVQMNDLDDLVLWAEKNDDAARQIAQNGHAWASKRLRYQDLECYWARVMMHYDHLVRIGKKLL